MAAPKESRERLLVLSENPINEIWTLLGLWESAALARKLVATRADAADISLESSLLDEKAQALRYCLRNARENLQGAEQSITRRVVSAYYGCMWFASAILAADPETDVTLKRLERFTKFGHGLGNIVAEDEPFPFNEYVVVKESGFFPQYLKALGINNKAIANMTLKSGRAASVNDLDTDDRSRIVPMLGLFARIPELADTYQYITGEHPLCFGVFHTSRNMGEDIDDATASGTYRSPRPQRIRDYTWVGVSASLHLPIEFLQENGPPLVDWRKDDYAGSHHWAGKLEHSQDKHWHEVLRVHKSAMSATTWTKPVLNEIEDAMAIHLMLLYQLSILARYRPAVWREIIEGNQDQYRALIVGYLNIVDRVMPEMVLRRIDNRRIHVTLPGSFTAPM